MSFATLKRIRRGRPVGYREGARIFQRKAPISQVPHDWDMPGAWVSPRGERWRQSGTTYPGVLLVNWDRNIGHSLAYETFKVLRRRGWIWVPDWVVSCKFKISRWPDGIHYYIISDSGEAVGTKHDTWEAAWLAGNRWVAETSVEKQAA